MIGGTQRLKMVTTIPFNPLTAGAAYIRVFISTVCTPFLTC